MTAETKDSVRVEQVLVAVHDTIMETTTIIVRESELGDTLRMTTVTDRVRVRERDAVALQQTKTEVVRDTVYVAVRDSVETSQKPQIAQNGGATPLVLTLKWVFWIIVALTVMMIVVWVGPRLKI